MKNRYSAKFIALSTLIYKCYDLGTGGGGSPMPWENMRSAPLPSGQECVSNTNRITTVNIEKPFLCPQVLNVNELNKIVSVTYLTKKGKSLIDPLSFVMNLSNDLSPNNAASTNVNPLLSRSVLSDNMLLMSDLNDLELPAGVYDFERYVYPVAGDSYQENRKVTQYLFYFEKN